VVAASDTASGIVELATTAETTTGTDTARAVTPAGLLNATTASNINARTAVKKAGTLIGTRRGINFIEGANVTLTVADDAGNEEVDVTIAASGGGGTTHALARKTADESVTSSTTLQDDDDLFFAIAANEVWVVEWVLFCGGSAANDSKFAVTVPSGATLAWSGFGTRESDTLVQVYEYITTSGSERVMAQRDAANYPTIIKGYVANSTTPGNVRLQYAQNVSGVNAFTVRAGSHMIAHKVA
jgi:hypothetical protein